MRRFDVSCSCVRAERYPSLSTREGGDTVEHGDGGGVVRVRGDSWQRRGNVWERRRSLTENNKKENERKKKGTNLRGEIADRRGKKPKRKANTRE